MSGENLNPLTYARELVAILASGDDAEDIGKSSKCCDTAGIVNREKNVRMTKLVENLAVKGEEKTKSFMACLEENKENEDVIRGLESKRIDAISNIENLNTQVGFVEETMKETELSASKVKEDKASIQHDTIEVLPKTKYAFSLYSNITRLRWDYESEEGELKGFVTSLRDVRPFTLNVENNTKYFTANYLWDVIASC